MVKIISYCCLALICIALLPTQAFAQYEVKDSFYFMKDDNKFSAEEKDEEAEYVYMLCARNPMKSVYFDCSCIAGAYRQERDKGPLVPQDQLLNSLFTDNQRGCANTAVIAGTTYQFCSDYTKSFRPRNRHNKEFCECVSNTTANNFAKKPYLKTSYIEKIRAEAMSSCK